MADVQEGEVVQEEMQRGALGVPSQARVTMSSITAGQMSKECRRGGHPCSVGTGKS